MVAPEMRQDDTALDDRAGEFGGRPAGEQRWLFQ